MASITTSLLNVTTAIVSPASPKRPRSALAPSPGAPLSDDPSLIPLKYLPEERNEPPSAQTSSLNLHPTRSNPEGSSSAPYLFRSPPSQLLDAPARAAMNLPNGITAPAQARAVRGGEAKTPEYELDEEPSMNGNGNGYESTPLLAPTPQRPGVSRTPSTSSTGSNRGILRRIFIDRASSPNQHLVRPTFPPPSASTYSPLPPSPLTISSKLNLFINQSISIILSTWFLAFVVLWALSAEIARGLPRWVWPDRPKRFPWDDEKYWSKEGKKISKDPSEYARQVGMDIEHQVVETEDGYFLKYAPLVTPKKLIV